MNINPEEQHAESTLKQKTVKGLFWGGMGNLIQQIVGMSFGIVIMRILSPDDFGLVGMLAIFTAIATIIMESGFTYALANKKEIRHEDYNAVFWFGLLASALMYLILFAAAPLIAWFFDRPVLTGLSRLLFLGFLINGAGMAHYAIMYKKIMVRERAKIDIAAVTISSSIGLTLALNGFAYWGIAIQTVSFSLIGVVLRWFYSSWRPTFRFDFTPLKEMFGFGSKILVTNIIYQISGNLFNVLLGKFYSETQVGYYTQGNKWMMLGYMTISRMIDSVAQPVFVEANRDKKRQSNILRKMLRFGAFVSFPAMLGLAFVGREFILITVGEKWMESVPILQILCIWGSFGYIWLLYTLLLMSYGKSNIYLYGNLSILALQLICVAVMYPFGILPMVGAYVSCYLSGILLWHYFVNKLIGIRLTDLLKDIMPYLGITLGCFVVAWTLTRSIENIYLLFGAKIAIVATLYFLIARFSGSVILKESITFFMSRIKRS